MTRPMAVLWLVLTLAGATCQAGSDVSVSELLLEPATVLQGEPLSITYTLTARGEDVSATAFVLPATVSAPPDNWNEVGLRVTPSYQIIHQEMAGEDVRCECRVPGRATAELPPGRYRAFVAVAGAGTGWQILTLGEFDVADAVTIDMPARSGRPMVAVLADELPVAGTASDPARVARLAEDVGCTARLIGGDELTDQSVFSRESFDLLVLPCGGCMPGEATSAVGDFLRHAGALITIGGAPLGNPVGAATVSREAATPLTIADMDGDAPLADLDTVTGPGSDGELRVVRGGAAGTRHALGVTASDLRDWFYVHIPLEGRLRETDVWLEFYARGDRRTDRLCLELVERDESRWKYFVELTPRWRAYSVRMLDFAAYVAPGREQVRPRDVVSLKLGFYRALYGSSHPRTLYVDEISASPAPHHAVDSRHEHLDRWRREYRRLGAVARLDALGLFRDASHLRDASGLVAADEQLIFPQAATIAGPVDGWAMTPRTVRSVPGDWGAAADETARYVPLLRACAEDGTALGDVGGMAIFHHGEYRGACIAWLGVTSHDLLDPRRPALTTGFRHLVRTLTSSAWLCSPRPEFSPSDDGIAQRWRVRVLSRGPRSGSATVALQAASGEGSTSTSVRLEPGRITSVELTAPPSKPDLSRFGGTLELRDAGGAIDRLPAVADTGAALKAVGRWLIANQTEAGNYSSIFYGDIYGARALRVLSELTGDERYRRSALRAADMMAREQRPDGGWWVGYGPPRELVFVADDGCIALGLVQLAPYCRPARRRAYLDAARRFIDFREGFRITEEVARQLEARYGENHPGVLRGGLGIGYVLRDYFSDGEPFDEPVREQRQKVWTLHCSLAFLGGLCALGEGPRACELAVQDTRWFLERIDEGRDSVTSGYANEAAVWMFDTVPDRDLRPRLRQHLEEDFLEFIRTAEPGWWLGSGGRKALMLPGLVYCTRELDHGSASRAALARALWGIACPASPTSLQRLLARHSRTDSGSVVMYATFSATGLAELLKPRSTLLPSQYAAQ
ncbi:MAG: hypothetical protein ACP5KN_00650 [Armatimonadota bacterium]